MFVIKMRLELRVEMGARRGPCEGQHPQTCAKADASEEFTLRAMVSSTFSVEVRIGVSVWRDKEEKWR